MLHYHSLFIPVGERIQKLRINKLNNDPKNKAITVQVSVITL
jgi:hypothetical protein